MTNPYYDLAYHVECPMADCIEILNLAWDACLTLSPDDLAGHDVGDADVTSWKVECLAGHVLLLPGPTGCPCEDDGGGVNCPHDENDYDWSEDSSRAFRASDAARLRDLIGRLS